MIDDDAMHQLLPLYVSGRLPPDELPGFERHLESCVDCREEKSFMEAVASRVERHGIAFLEDHPPPDVLIAFVGGELPDPDRARVREHVELCAMCSVEVRWISGDEAFGAARPSGNPRRNTVRRWPWVAAVAAAFLIGVSLPALLSRRAPTREFLTPQFIARTERSGDARAAVQISGERAGFSVYFAVDLPASGFPCRVEILDHAGRSIESTRVARRDELVEGQFLFFDCKARDCGSGAYSIRIVPDSGEPVESIPFDVIAR